VIAADDAMKINGPAEILRGRDPIQAFCLLDRVPLESPRRHRLPRAKPEFVSTGQGGPASESDSASLADTDADGLGRAREHRRHRVGIGGVAAVVPAWDAVRLGAMAAANRGRIGTQSFTTSARSPEDGDKMNNIGSRPLSRPRVPAAPFASPVHFRAAEKINSC
jgi:hypothetical protein